MKKIVCAVVAISFCALVFAQGECSFQGDILGIMPNSGVESAILQLDNDDFLVSRDKADIPAVLISQVECSLMKFNLANPDEAFSTGCVVINDYNSRLLLYAQSKDLMILAHLHKTGSGMGSSAITNIWILRYGRSNIKVNENDIYFRNIWFDTWEKTNISDMDDLRHIVYAIWKDWDKKFKDVINK